jgi:hypothetical protein
MIGPFVRNDYGCPFHQPQGLKRPRAPAARDMPNKNGEGHLSAILDWRSLGAVASSVDGFQRLPSSRFIAFIIEYRYRDLVRGFSRYRKIYIRKRTLAHNTAFRTSTVSLTNIGYLVVHSLFGITIILREVARHSNKTNRSASRSCHKKDL